MPEWFQSVLSRRTSKRSTGPMSQDDVSAIRDNAERVALMVRARWILLAAMAGFAAVSGAVAVLSGDADSLTAGVAVPINALLLAIAYNFVSDRLRPLLATVRHASTIQFTLDILIVALVLVFTGGPQSWLWVLYILIIFEGATIARDRSDVWWVAAMTIVAMTVVDWGQLPNLLAPLGAMPLDPEWLEWPTVAQCYALHLSVLITAAGVSNAVILSLHERLDRARALSIADEQTGCPSRAAFHRGLETEYARALRAERPVYLLLVDIDNLTTVNSQFGIAVGDEVIRKVAETLQQSLHQLCCGGWSPNSVYRVSGEEFAVVVVDSPSTADGRPSGEEIAQLAELIRSKIAHLSLGGVSVTVSVGGAVTSPAVADAEELLVSADDALARAVAAGGNRVVLEWWTAHGETEAADSGDTSPGTRQDDLEAERHNGPTNPFIAQFED